MKTKKLPVTALLFCFIFPFIILLTACGLGGESITLPEKRPNGIVTGNVLGGLYSKGTMTAYSLSKTGEKIYLTHTEISEQGKFHLTFSAPSQPILLEATDGSYFDPSLFQLTSPIPGLVLSQIISYSSGQVHTRSLTPITHFSTGLILYWQNNHSIHINETQINRANQLFSDLYGHATDTPTTSLYYDKNTRSMLIKRNDFQGLFISGLAQIAREESKGKDDALKINYSLSALIAIIYEDIISDGLLNGESIFKDSKETKKLTFGGIFINPSFYRLNIAFAQNKSLQYTTTTTAPSVLIENFLSIAQNNSELLPTLDPLTINNSIPLIHFLTNADQAKKATFALEFSVDNALVIDSIQVHFNDEPFIYSTAELTKKPGNFFSLSINTKNHTDGIQNIKITATNHLAYTGTNNTNYTFDNTAPELSIKSGNLTNTSPFELKGSYFDEYSTVAKLTIDNETIELTADAKWEKSVFLSNGYNEFLIKIEDIVGNSTQIKAHVLYDEFAPVLTLTSSALTSTSQFELQGEFIEGESGIKEITVNGSPAGIITNSKWSKLVSLNRGNNEFTIAIEDEAGNKATFPARIFLDDIPPEISIISANLTNSETFLLEGEYRERNFGDNEILVNGTPATRLQGERWSIPVALTNGDNIFTITLKDELNNQATFQTSVTLDRFAPIINLSSSALSNAEQFTLSGTYMDGESGVKQITVNDINSTLIDEQLWEIPILLTRGNNTFIVRTEDEAGNISEFTTAVFFDNTPPLITIASDTETNTQQFLMHGEYTETESGVKNITVNDQKANILANNQWSISVELQRGDNNIAVSIEDKAGNRTEINHRIDLDDQAPVISHTPTSARFSNNDGTYFIENIELENSPPLFIELNQLSLLGMIPSEANLNNANIPYLSFSIEDLAAEGFKTAAQDLEISYQYSINDTSIIPWQTINFDVATGNILIPLTTEQLSNAWYKAHPNDIHTIEVRAIDNFNNSAVVSSTFQAHFFSTELAITIDETAETISKGSYATRENYINNEFIAVNYKIHNPHDYALKIKASDSSLHQITQEYDKVIRENKVRLKSIELWEVAQLSGNKLLGTICPAFDSNSWQNINHLFNFMNGSWVKIFPNVMMSNIEQVNTDIPIPPLDSEWAPFTTNDGETFSMRHIVSNETRVYQMDYLRDYDVPGSIANAINNPGFVNAWHYTLSDTSIVGPCPPSNGIRTKTQYEYQTVEGYPKNTLNNLLLISQFESSRFEFIDESSEVITERNGWYEIPAKQTVLIKKYVNSYGLALHNDESVKTPEIIDDYLPHFLDKKTTWTIDQDITIETQFNPSDLLDSQSNIRHQTFDNELELIEFTRN